MNAQSKMEPTSIVGVLAQALPALGAVHKNKKNPAFKSNYADLTAVLQALAPITEHGLWFRQEARPCENGVALETFYIHESGAELSAGITTVPVNKADAQGYGSAQTYCRRYALLTAFGLSADDDDGNAAAKSPPRQEAAKPQPPISDEQAVKLTTLLQATGVTPAQFCQIMGCQTVAALPAAKFEEAETRLNERLAKLAKAETNAKAQETVDA